MTKEERKVKNRSYYIEHREQILKVRKEYSRAHKKEIKEYFTRYRHSFPEKFRGYHKKYKTKLEVKLLYTLRSRLWYALKKNKKSQKTIKLLGCTILELKQYLEKQFKPGMSWDNHGTWHVDHIKPCCTFDLSKPEEQCKCFNYTNLQPLWAVDNFKKGGK